ncbi:MAG TPA: polyphosphate polymerase domain-containing protein [Ignavibacteriaceae bacterium]
MKPLRLEYKFLLPVERIDELRRAISPFVFIDEYAEREINKEYTVHSIYFDTMRLDDYHDKLSGIKIRKKLRIRGYNYKDEKSIVFLEIKRKYENHISKNRAPLFFSDLKEIFNTADCEKYVLKKSNYIDAVNDARKFFYLSKIKNCSPVVLINYEREAYFSKHDTTLRITFDKNLRSTPLPDISDLYNEAGLKYAMPGNLILEVKFFSGFPEWLQKILKKFELKRQAVSKYTICVDSHKNLRKYVNGSNLLMPSNLNKNRFNYIEEKIKHAG